MDIWRSCRRGGDRGRGLRRGRFGRVRSHGRKRLWKMACRRAPTKGGRIAHLTTKRFRPFEAIRKKLINCANENARIRSDEAKEARWTQGGVSCLNRSVRSVAIGDP